MSVRSIGAILSYRAYPTLPSTTTHDNTYMGVWIHMYIQGLRPLPPAAGCGLGIAD